MKQPVIDTSPNCCGLFFIAIACPVLLVFGYLFSFRICWERATSWVFACALLLYMSSTRILFVFLFRLVCVVHVGVGIRLYWFLAIAFHLLIVNSKMNEPLHEKTCLRGLRSGKTQTDLLSYRDQLEAWNFKYENRGIILSRQRTTKALIRCAGWFAPLLFAYGIHRFSHDVAHEW